MAQNDSKLVGSEAMEAILQKTKEVIDGLSQDTASVETCESIIDELI